MKINDMIYDMMRYNTIYIILCYVTLHYIILYYTAQLIMRLPVFLYEHRNISSIQNTVLLTVLLGALDNQQSAKAK
jgi:hypothetical protein